jgi:hypothetical protein
MPTAGPRTGLAPPRGWRQHAHMSSFLLILIIAGAAYLWIRRTREGRERWISRLALPGVWSCDTPEGPSVLEFAGAADEGTFIEQSPGATERGRWRIQGSGMVLESDRGARSYELRLFENGSLGIDGPDRVRRIYVRQRNNVVPLRQRR